ncbi:carboxypeptidase [Falsirhodobacter xinxiangensis]|uniref:carboxypeptidase n=1 Tax=Falsirhodobacter xinxiangensis TaxID=2530049 RepID=UPI001C6FDF1A|nr:carboxypeptidase [Rhodobacter xinxiangensis]
MSINLTLGHTQLIRNECALRGLTRQQTAYVLATAFWEGGRKMVPVEENLRYTAERIRQVWPTRFASVAEARPYASNPQGLANRVYGGRMGNTLANDGWTYRGRGHVQITGRDNYVRAGAALGIDLITKPDRALEPDIAAQILVLGMQKGWFTGKKLSDFIGSTVDYRGARRIVNGTDSADEIASLARQYETALSVQPEPVRPPKPAPKPTLWDALASIFNRIFKGA